MRPHWQVPTKTAARRSAQLPLFRFLLSLYCCLCIGCVSFFVCDWITLLYFCFLLAFNLSRSLSERGVIIVVCVSGASH